MRDFPQSREVQLTVNGLRVIREGLPKLNIASLDIFRPGPTVILGPNGAGKSLLLRAMHGLIRPEAGHILQDGRPIDAAARARQAMVFQRPVLLRRTVAGNLAFVLRRAGVSRALRAERIADLLAEAHLTDKARQNARSLSGGEAQRLAFIRAWATEPAVLFLDEPTSALDPASTAAIEDLIKAAARSGTRVVMVTHDIGQARRLAEEIVFLAAGSVVEQTPADAFFDTPSSPQARRYLAGGLVL